jgi:hypothetical protein
MKVKPSWQAELPTQRLVWSERLHHNSRKVGTPPVAGVNKP